MVLITIKGVNGTGTNLKRTTKNIDTPKNHNIALNKNLETLLLKVPDSFFAGFFVFFDVIFVAILLKLIFL